MKAGHVKHGFPYAAIVLISLVLEHFADSGRIIQTDVNHIRYYVTYMIIHGQVALYLYPTFKILTDYRKRLKDHFSAIEHINLNWVNVLLYSFILMWLINVIQYLLGAAGIMTEKTGYIMTFVAVLVNCVFAIIITFNGIVQSNYLTGMTLPGPYAMSRLSQSDCREIVRKLTQVMENDRIFLTPSLSVEDLARLLKVPARAVSQSIRMCLNSNYYDFINRYRIEEVKRRIGDASSSHLSFLGLAYEAGFNSKSVFNAAFKKHTGMTPKTFRQSVCNSPQHVRNPVSGRIPQ